MHTYFDAADVDLRVEVCRLDSSEAIDVTVTGMARTLAHPGYPVPVGMPVGVTLVLARAQAEKLLEALTEALTPYCVCGHVQTIHDDTPETRAHRCLFDGCGCHVWRNSARQAAQPEPRCVCGHGEDVHWWTIETHHRGCVIEGCECLRFDAGTAHVHQPEPEPGGEPYATGKGTCLVCGQTIWRVGNTTWEVRDPEASAGSGVRECLDDAGVRGAHVAQPDTAVCGAVALTTLDGPMPCRQPAGHAGPHVPAYPLLPR